MYITCIPLFRIGQIVHVVRNSKFTLTAVPDQGMNAKIELSSCGVTINRIKTRSICMDIHQIVRANICTSIMA